MAVSEHFKSVCSTLSIAAGNAGVHLDTYDLLNLSTALIDMGFNATEPEPTPTEEETQAALSELRELLIGNPWHPAS